MKVGSKLRGVCISLVGTEPAFSSFSLLCILVEKIAFTIHTFISVLLLRVSVEKIVSFLLPGELLHSLLRRLLVQDCVYETHLLKRLIIFINWKDCIHATHLANSRTAFSGGFSCSTAASATPASVRWGCRAVSAAASWKRQHKTFWAFNVNNIK